ncbi:alternative ribosome rescue aminoacyl-tRNA hydrolase ArfB [Psychroflexus planctonicus]|uniref:Prokaryotic-type class I peptide chain release factors domain-containing protein n=1 Tax=Psychroflexus planctonicus TaxID=1526575 RepID=A0ABQ1SJT2_9FLAO|nr:alternative ribosome rescue aminoacyl-tRNA hydrolase ArfB [Psychroflexus planctonicus]GGE40360.1 hypothetical protein GCM10010832_20620 [Psychroflexus planctonicus]
MNKDKLLAEITFKTTLSGGPGGQHVNKTETKVLVNWDIENSQAVSDDEKNRIASKLSSKINKEGELQVASAKTRSQHQNKQIAIDVLVELVEKALMPKKKRKKSKPSFQSKLKRLKKKKIHSEKKKLRKNPRL